MPRLNTNTDVMITLKGLGVGHYNPTNSKWEIIFLRGISNHFLRITVKKHYKSSSGPVTIKSEFIDLGVQNIEINTAGAKSVAGDHRPDCNFSWNPDGNTASDSRWMADLSSIEFHNKNVKLTKKTTTFPPIGLTLLTVSNAVFYTNSQTDKYKLYPIYKKPNTLIKKRIMGHYGGLDIEWDETKNPVTEIAYDGSPFDDIKPDASDPDVLFYEIEIDNDCFRLCPVGQTDFHFYYDYLVDMGDEVFEQGYPVDIRNEKVPLKKLILETFGINDLFLGQGEKSQSIFNLFGLENTSLEFKIGRTDCHIVIVSQLDGQDSLAYLLTQ